MSVTIKSTEDEIKAEMKESIAKIMSVENEIKSLKEDIKIIKQDAKDAGVDIKVMNKVYSIIKRRAKEKDDPVYSIANDFANEFNDLIEQLVL